MLDTRKVQEARKDANLSQEALAQKLGVSLRTITRLEGGNTVKVDFSLIASLAELVNKPIDYFLMK